LAADRLPQPDWSPPAVPERFRLTAGALLSALESAGTPAAMLESLRGLDATTGVDILLAPDRSLVQLLVDGRRVALAGATRDAVLTLLGDTAGTAATPARLFAAALPDAFLSARVAAVRAQVQESRAHVADSLATVEDVPPAAPAIELAAPLMRAGGADALAAALQQAVGSSGLFLEAHLAQWLRGERSLGRIQEEVDALPENTPGTGAAASQGRADAQADALRNQTIRLEVPAWRGQPMLLEIARDPDRRGAAMASVDAPQLFQATLTLHLPHLGPLRARIRVMHDTVGLQIATDNVSRVSADLPGLADSLAARGFNMAALDLTPLTARAAPAPR
jgi:hypothetical protein